MLIQIDDKEHATVLAALRYWARLRREHLIEILASDEWQQIATDGDAFDPLDDTETEALAERLYHHEPPVIGIGINTDGGMIQSVFTDRQDVTINCITCDYDVEGSGDHHSIVPIAEDGGNASNAAMGKQVVSFVPDDFATYVEAKARADHQWEVYKNSPDYIPF